jgi:hypothetical protein
MWKSNVENCPRFSHLKISKRSITKTKIESLKKAKYGKNANNVGSVWLNLLLILLIKCKTNDCKVTREKEIKSNGKLIGQLIVWARSQYPYIYEVKYV